MKFRYYITSTMDGMITGTDDEAVAKDAAESEDNFVLDSTTGEWFMPGDAVEEIKLTSHTASQEDEEEEEDEDDEEEDDDFDAEDEE